MFPPKGSLRPDENGLRVVQNICQFGHQPRPQLILLFFSSHFQWSSMQFQATQYQYLFYPLILYSTQAVLQRILYQVSTPFTNSRSKLKFFTTCQRQMTKPRPLHKYPNQAHCPKTFQQKFMLAWITPNRAFFKI